MSQCSMNRSRMGGLMPQNLPAHVPPGDRSIGRIVILPRVEAGLGSLIASRGLVFFPLGQVCASEKLSAAVIHRRDTEVWRSPSPAP